MDSNDIRKILTAVADGVLPVDEASRSLESMPFLRVGDVAWDTHRLLRRGIAEAIYGEGKTTDQICNALNAAMTSGTNCVVTRIGRQEALDVLDRFPRLTADGQLSWNDVARLISLKIRPVETAGRGTVVVITAGTSDIPVAEEAAMALEMSGDRVMRIRDVGVAGIHRLAPHLEAIRGAAVAIVVAGMEGALPGVIAGLGPAPVIGVPTSVGYGTAFGGLTALLAMLNSCAGGVTVVNIDNGYGAAVAAHLMNSDRPMAALEGE